MRGGFGPPSPEYPQLNKETDMSTDHKIWVLFQMEEMDGTAEESAMVLLDQYVADEVTVLTVLDYESNVLGV